MNISARILPILTEVVPPQGLAPPPVSSTPEFEDMVRTVLERVNDSIEYRLLDESRAMVDRLVNDQMQSLHVQLRQELEQVVRQAVAEALRSD